MHRHVYSFILMILAATLLAACGSADKGPAEAALKAAEEAVNAAKVEASKYVPDQVGSLESALAGLKEKFSKGDYKAVVSEAPALASRAKEAANAAAAKKVELTKTWEELNRGLPKVVDAIKSRVDVLSQSKKLPAGMTADKLGQAKAGLAEITQQWTAATTASSSGNLMEAVTKANTVKAKAAEVLTALNMRVPDALKG